MDAGRWRSIEELYHAAGRLRAQERAAFLAGSAADPSIIAEVESLLANELRGGGRLEVPAWEGLMASTGTHVPPAGGAVGRYQIAGILGEGGMGVVWKARDTELNRWVALRTLPAGSLGDEARQLRLLQEARAASALNHPSIVTVHDLVHHEGGTFLVMELVQGRCISELIPVDGMRVEEALGYALQMADALAAAHSAGIVHRDLKPRNVMVTTEGRIKVLDFGLAKLTRPEQASSNLTQSGLVVGTGAYMSPEQAQGREVDRRSDIFSFGAVLYEMLSGRRAFPGDSVQASMAAVMTVSVDPIRGLPLPLERILERCLRKDRERRAQHLDDIGVELKDLNSDPVSLAPEPLLAPPARRRLTWAWLLFAVGLLAVLAYSMYQFREGGGQTLYALSLMPTEKVKVNDQFSIPAVSPDGRRIVFAAETEGGIELHVRELDSHSSRAIPGTGGAEYPFWSPDSRHIAFFADGKLKRIALDGGPVMTLCDVSGARGGTWGKDVLVWGSFGRGLFRVPAAVGPCEPLTEPGSAPGAGDHRFPSFLPGGRHLVYTDTSTDPGQGGIYLGDIESRERKRVIATVSNAVFSPPGYLLFVREQTLMAQPFDPVRLRTSGDPAPVAERVDSQQTRAQNLFSVSGNGVLVYASAGRSSGSLLTWFDRSGRVLGGLGAATALSWGAISPDGSTVAVQRSDHGLSDIWLHDLRRDSSSRFTFGPGGNSYPAWSRDGKYLSFFSLRDGIGRPFLREIGGMVQDEALSASLGQPPSPSAVEDWSPDGRECVVRVVSTKTQLDLWVLSFDRGKRGSGKPSVYLATEFSEGYARISPDGKWLAYTSNESRRNEVYVRSFPTPGPKIQISRNGGERSVWSRDGKELYFISSDGRMMAAAVTRPETSRLEAAVPVALFPVRPSRTMDAWFDVTRNGRFLVPVQEQAPGSAPLAILINWQRRLAR